MNNQKLYSIKDIIPQLKQWFIQYSTPLFHINSKNQKELVGSGTYVDLDGLKVLITARHIIVDYPHDQIYVPRRIKQGMVHLFGICRASKFPLSDEYDHIDVALFELDSSCASDIGTSFLPMEYINFDHSPSSENIYCAVGVPHRKARYSKAAIGNVSLILENIANSGSKSWAYKNEFNEKDHIIMDYPKKMLNDTTYELVITPKIDGMSGGSLWHIDPKIEFYLDRPNVKMVGILTQYCTNHIYGTNIKHIKRIYF